LTKLCEAICQTNAKKKSIRNSKRTAKSALKKSQNTCRQEGEIKEKSGSGFYLGRGGVKV